MKMISQLCITNSHTMYDDSRTQQTSLPTVLGVIYAFIPLTIENKRLRVTFFCKKTTFIGYFKDAMPVSFGQNCLYYILTIFKQ